MRFGRLTAVADVSFTLGAGQLLGLVGPNGAGKTTLLRVCAGLQVPLGGTARVLGEPVLEPATLVRQHIGFGPDDPPAYPDLTIEQFLQFIGGAYGLSPRETDERIDFWLEQLWLTERRRSKIKELSRGMRQRVTLARTFLPQPHVILLDEPLSGIDPAGRIQLRQVLSSLREQGCAMIVSSHILSDLEEVATDVAIIERGRVLRWSRAGDAGGAETAHCRYRLKLLHTTPQHVRDLATIPNLTGVETQNGVITFEYSADELAAAELLRQLVDAGLPVVSFTPLKESLEELYLRAGVQQVD